MTYKDQPFYPEYMEKKYRRPPLCLCQSKLEQKLGIISPSKDYRIGIGGGTDDETKQAAEWFAYMRRYNCYRRLLDKNGWRLLYRDCRIKRREMNECTSSAKTISRS